LKKHQKTQAILDEIAHLESKADHAKSFSDDESYPKSSRDRFFKRYYEYKSEIKNLEKILEESGCDTSKYEGKPKPIATEIVEDLIDISEEYDEDNEDSYLDDDDDFREEIDFSDSRRALDVFNSLYPEGLDDE
jgi:hypothetical protein